MLAAATAAGCAGAGAPIARRTPAPPPFRWLIAVAGPQPDPARENRHRGTRAWRLAGGPPAQLGGVRSGDVAGYVSAPTILPGQAERIYVSAPGARRVRIRVFRIGWYGGLGGREVLRTRWLGLRPQPPCRHDARTGLTECRWHPSLAFTAVPGLPSGVYVAQLTVPGGQSDCLFVVRSASRRPLLAQLPTSTYEAYNAWGGDSLYPGGRDRVGATGTTQGVAVSLERPYDSVTGAGQFFARDVAMVRFLERYGYPVSYTTSESADADPRQLLGHRALLDFGHSEYWSQRQYDGFRRALGAGTSLLFLSSDTLAWRVRYTRSPFRPGRAAPGGPVIFADKEHAAAGSQASGAFPAGGAPLTGSAYVGCITPRLAVAGPPVYRYYGWSPRALEPRWLFAGTGLAAGTVIPGIVGYELDQLTGDSPPGTRVLGEGHAPCSTEAGEPQARLAPNLRLAETTLRTTGSGAIVFSTGTLGWELGLEPVPSASPDAPRAPDPRLVALTRNLLAHVLAARTGRRGR